MNFELSSAQIDMRDAVRRMVDRELMPIAMRHREHERLSKESFLEILRVLGQQRLTAARLPEAAGGPGISMLDYGIVFEQIPPHIGISLLAHEGCVARLYLEGSPAHKARLLPDLIAGHKIGCTGSTEPDTGSDPRGIKTRLVREKGVFRLYGRKMWVTNASLCDVMIVTCLDAREGTPARGVIKVVLDRVTTSFETQEIDAIGLNQGSLGEAIFEGCIVPDDSVIDSGAEGTAVLKQTWHVNRPLFGLSSVHLAQKAFDIALDYSKTRKAFGKLIAGHQLVQRNLSDMATAIEASRLLCYSALARIDRGEAAEGASAMAKRFAQNSCEQVVREAMNMLGALGLSREAGLERMYRDARMLAMPDGTNEILALIHGRALTGVAAFRDAQ